MGDAFTADDFAQADTYGNLGPAYFAAQRVMADFMKAFTDEHLHPMVKAISDEIYSQVQTSFEAYLFENAELNTASAIDRMVHETVKALLAGDEWAMKRYPLASRYEADKVREAIAKHIPAQLQDARIKDLEAEVARLTEDVKFLRRDR